MPLVQIVKIGMMIVREEIGARAEARTGCGIVVTKFAGRQQAMPAPAK